MCATRRRLCSTRMFRASRSPARLRSRYICSSRALRGLGKEPEFPVSRRVRKRLLASKKSAADSISIAPFFVPSYASTGSPYNEKKRALRLSVICGKGEKCRVSSSAPWQRPHGADRGSPCRSPRFCGGCPPAPPAQDQHAPSGRFARLRPERPRSRRRPCCDPKIR